ncbi:hypothetical protein BGZ65_012169 [Modicella reniformis]|uniref:Uncharacterized protein n=1 Tax=Modicella reniformis TaxID=1440133 RepID=A0A9P6SUJ4_9FUNG|nr:hypothetical protein BGZ65_012169 [Modicella reniformis]
MILPFLNIFILAILLTVFRFLLVNTVSTALAVYSKYGGEYANSIRWSRDGGYIEMVKCLFNSRKTVSTSVSFAMAVTLIASLVASSLDKGVAKGIRPTIIMEPERDPYRANSTQFASGDTQFVFSGWNTVNPYGSNITNTIERLINDTRNIPAFEPGKMYTPRTSGYTILCESFPFTLTNQLGSDGECGSLAFNFNHGNATGPTSVVQSKDRLSIVQPGGILSSYTFDLTSSIYRKGHLCPLVNTFTNVDRDAFQRGMTALPKTYVAKCMNLTSGEVITLSRTSTKFWSSNDQDGDGFLKAVVETFGDKDDELIQAIHARTLNITSSPSSDRYFLMEAKSAGPFADAIACLLVLDNEFPPRFVESDCIYVNFFSLVLIPDNVDDFELLGKKRLDTQWTGTDLSPIITIEHSFKIVNGSITPYLLSDLRNSTETATKYFASLGLNLYGGYTYHWTFILFDVFNPKDALFIQDWLAYSVLGIAVVCLVVLGTKETIASNSDLTPK